MIAGISPTSQGSARVVAKSTISRPPGIPEATDTVSEVTSRTRYDVAIVGAGHNGLTAAAYLAKAGLSVVVLERLGHVGGAAVSAEAFPGRPTRLSRYSVPGLPAARPDRARPRPRPRAGLARDGVVHTRRPRRQARRSPRRADRGRRDARSPSGELTGSDDEYDAWRTFYTDVARLGWVVAPTLLQPLPRASRIRSQVSATTWARRRRVAAGRGDRAPVRRRHRARRGRHRRPDRHLRLAARPVARPEPVLPLPPDRQRHRRVAGAGRRHGCGDRRADEGGSRRRRRDRHRRRGARDPSPATSGAEVRAGTTATPSTACRRASYSPTSHRGCSACCSASRTTRPPSPQGAQLKVNFLLDRLPRLKSGVDPEVAFAGTLHLSEGYGELLSAYGAAVAGRLPDPLPGEVYCHSLTDPSILGDAPAGTHTLTYFGLHTPGGALRGRPRGHQGRRRCDARSPPSTRTWSSRSSPASRATRNGAAVHRGEDPAGHRARPGHARRPHLPRRPGVAVGSRPRPPGDTGRALGRADQPRRRCCSAARARAGAAPSPASAVTTPRRPCSSRADPPPRQVLSDFSARVARW